MSTNTGLVPEKRVDKNGKLVTRMVKPDDQKVSGKYIPQPKIEDAALAEKRRLDTLEHTAAKIYKDTGGVDDLGDLIDSLMYMSPRTAETVVEHYSESPEDASFLSDLLIEHNGDDDMNRNAVLLKSAFHNDADYWRVATVVNGLSKYDFMDEEYLEDITSDQQRYRQTEALCRVTAAMIDMPFIHAEGILYSPHDTTHIIDEGMVDVIKEYAEQDREIIDLIEQRKMLDSTMIRQYFESPTAALRTGEL